MNCSPDNRYKELLIGEWNYEETPSLSLIFTIDTLYINSTLKTKQNWSIDDSNIYLKNTIDYRSNKRLEGEDFRTQFVYSLNEKKDILSWRAKNDNTNKTYKFIKNQNE